MTNTTPPIFVDTTMRDGEQASGVAFTIEEKLCLTRKLIASGIKEFEIGTPAMGDVAQKEIYTLTHSGFDAKMFAWCRAMSCEIELTRKCGIEGIHFSFPVSDRLIGVMNKSKKWVLGEVKALVAQASESFDYVSIGAQDASRAEHSFLEDFVGEAKLSGINRLRIADTVGTLNPFTTHALMSKIRNFAGDLSLEFHAHNDLGMACANSLAAWLAGSDSLSTTVNGLGERAGNAALEEIVMAVELSAGVNTGIDKSKFADLCAYVEKISGRKNSLSKPIVGELTLTHESGIHTKYLLKDRQTYQIISAKQVGMEEANFKIGKHTGTSTLAYTLDSLGVSHKKEHLNPLLEQVRNRCTLFKRDMQAKELVHLYENLIKHNNERISNR
ncbi:MAG: pyruvate carboxyltransferase [Rikenellaceae bacterium]